MKSDRSPRPESEMSDLGSDPPDADGSGKIGRVDLNGVGFVPPLGRSSSLRSNDPGRAALSRWFKIRSREEVGRRLPVVSYSLRIWLSLLLGLGIARSTLAQPDLANPASLPRLAPSLSASNTFGTTETSFSVLISSMFSPIDSTTTYADSFFPASQLARYATGGTPSFTTSADLPSGALIVSLEMDACDSSASDQHVTMLLGFCNRLGMNCVAIGSLMQTVSDATVPCKATVQDLTALNHTVDNENQNYFVLAVTASLDSSTAFAAARIGYRLQVSPAPAKATFPDVPSSDFGFQFVEALVASGITGGCGGGLYCPDAPVTRRQMAIFIAKALGLQWR